MATYRTRCRRRLFQPDAPFLTVAPKGDSSVAENEPGTERRGRSRRTFRLNQQIAPGYCWEVPPDSAWIDVQCYDLTQGGFSFFLDEKPNFERLVARFRLTESIYMAARVIRWRPVMVDAWGGIIEPGTIGRSDIDRRPQRIEVPRRLPTPAAVRALGACSILHRPGQCIIESLPVGVLKGFLGICLVDRAMSRIVALMIIGASLCRPGGQPGARRRPWGTWSRRRGGGGRRCALRAGRSPATIPVTPA